ncbi:uncharacterized protein LOC121870341 [Homarus americanus]|uniref:uncharacterized protein LOC121870341 n=1 Tax=Homarus americanus TaxID=6706 RepID=UPI001C491B08|nr:uncharacterized protein LOC121870341 [Homarus americanus]
MVAQVEVHFYVDDLLKSLDSPNEASILACQLRRLLWRHVSTSLNPADEATLGLPALDLFAGSRWIRGPEFLLKEEDQWPKGKELPVALSDLLEVHSVARNKNKDLRLKLKRLSAEELQSAEGTIICLVQKEVFEKEIQTLIKGELPRESKLYRLETYLDERTLLSSGGRIRGTLLGRSGEEPILLPRDHNVTEIIVREMHEERVGHAGREHTMAYVKQRYWIPRGRRLLDRIIRRCVVCRRNNWRSTPQGQVDLSIDRVTPGKAPFAYTGKDCFGPFIIKVGRKQVKRWGCLFTCVTTRAVHLEVLASLDADAFLNAVTSFSRRRGTPERMRSDNGTNMIRATKELKLAVKSWEQDDRLRGALLKADIEWVFNPPAAPYMGGVWERQIRTVKKVLQAIVGSHVLDDERLQTLFCEVEAIVNERPITPMPNTPNEPKALTPAHLLHLSRKGLLPLGGRSIGESYQRRWKHVQYVADQFWKEYLPQLRTRRGHFRPRRNFRPGDIIIISEANCPCNQWHLGRLMEVKVGEDELVQQAEVNMATRTILRPVTK